MHLGAIHLCLMRGELVCYDFGSVFDIGEYRCFEFFDLGIVRLVLFFGCVCVEAVTVAFEAMSRTTSVYETSVAEVV